MTEGDPGQPVRSTAALLPTGLAVFDRGDFEDLWRELVVGEFDPTATEVLRASDVEPDTDPELTLWNLTQAAVKVDDRGVWIKRGKKGKKGKPALGVQLWSPRMHLQDAGNWRSSPALPFPFSPGQLAAFMLAGPGWWLGEAFGGLDEPAPDLSRLPVERDMEAAAERTIRLLVLTWAAYHAAVQAVGPRPADSAKAIGHGDGGADDAPAAKDAPRANSDRALATLDRSAWLDRVCGLLDQPHRGGAPATPEDAETPSHSQKRWTPEMMAALAEFQAQHGATAAARHYRVSVSRVNEKLREHRDTVQQVVDPTAHAPFPGRKGLR